MPQSCRREGGCGSEPPEGGGGVGLPGAGWGGVGGGGGEQCRER